MLIYPAPELFIKAHSVQQPAGAPDLLACAASIYILFITSSTLERALDPASQNECAWSKIFIHRVGFGMFFMQGFPSWVFFGDWANCVLFIKTRIHCGLMGLARWWKLLLCLLLCIQRFFWDKSMFNVPDF